MIILRMIGLALVFFCVTHAQAMVISLVKGKKILVDLQGSEAVIGQQLNLLNSKNTVVGVIKIQSSKNGKALGLLIKGKATGKETLVPMAPTAAVNTPTKPLAKALTKSQSKLQIKSQASAVAPPPPKLRTRKIAPTQNLPQVDPQPVGPRQPYRASLLLGLATNTLSIRVTDGVTSQNVDNTGNSVSLALAVDRQFMSWLKLRGLLGYDQFNATGAATINGCENRSSKDCKTDIKYLSTGAYVKYEKEYSKFRVWGGAGLFVKIPISKSSTALVESSLGPTMAYAAGLGADYVLETKSFIVASLEKQFYIKSDSAETSTLLIRLGAGKEF
jgi:hypothetical protein